MRLAAEQVKTHCGDLMHTLHAFTLCRYGDLLHRTLRLRQLLFKRISEARLYPVCIVVAMEAP